MSKRRLHYVQQDDTRSILLDYYQGAYGRTLRIDTQSLEGMRALAVFLEGLCEGATSAASLCSIENVVLAAPLVDVRLLVSASESISASESAYGTAIEWTNHQRGWEHVAGLIGSLEVLGREGKSGHQYLTAPQTEILVELALLE